MTADDRPEPARLPGAKNAEPHPLRANESTNPDGGQIAGGTFSNRVAMAGAPDKFADGETPPAPRRKKRKRRCVELLKRRWLGESRQEPANHHESAGLLAAKHRTDESMAGANGDQTERRFSRFRIVRELGSGGFGVVFLVDDPMLGRQAALKVPHPDSMLSEKRRQRFLREARAAASLEHPNIAAIHDYGDDAGICYIVFAYCEGKSLADLLKGHNDGLPIADAASIARDLALATAHAHGRGVVHRDLKPANILIGSNHESTLSPKITDFGLAKTLDDEAGATTSGAILGTPRYMSPEQAAGRIRELGPAVDIYALGVILYEMLTGHPPFADALAEELFAAIQSKVPPAPRRLRREIPADLDAICLRCLEKRPGDRYSSAANLAEDIQCFIDGRPVAARRPSAAGRLLRWARRRPVEAGLSAAVVLASIAAFAGVIVHNVRLGRLTEDLKSANRQLMRQVYHADMTAAFSAYNAQKWRMIQPILDRQIPKPGEPDPRGFEWRLLSRLIQCDGIRLQGHKGIVYGLSFAPDGKTLASSGQDGRIRLWNVEGRSLIRLLKADGLGFNGVVFSPDGKLLASGGEDGKVCIWNAGDGSQLQECKSIKGGGKEILALDFSPDGKHVASSGRGRDVEIWDVHTGAIVFAFACEDKGVHALAWLPDGKRILLAGETVLNDRAALLYDAKTGMKIRTLGVGDQCVAVSPSGNRLAFRSGSGVVVMDVDGKLISRTSDIDSVIRGLCFCGNDLFAVTSHDETVRIFDANGHRTPMQLPGHAGTVWCAASSRDGRWLATSDGAGDILLWDLKGRFARTQLVHGNDDAFFLDFANAGGQLLCMQKNGVPNLLKLGGPLPSIDHSVDLWPHPVPDANWAMSPSANECLMDWETGRLARLDTQRLTMRLLKQSFAPKMQFAFSPDGSKFAVVDADCMRLFDNADERVIWSVRPEQQQGGIFAFVAGGSAIAWASADRLTFLDVATGQVTRSIFVGPIINRMATNREGKFIAWPSEATGGTPSIKVFGLDGMRVESEILCVHAHSAGMVFVPGESTLVACLPNRTITFWNAPTGQEMGSLQVGRLGIKDLRFDSRGMYLLTRSDYWTSAANPVEALLWTALPKLSSP